MVARTPDLGKKSLGHFRRYVFHTFRLPKRPLVLVDHQGAYAFDDFTVPWRPPQMFGMEAMMHHDTFTVYVLRIGKRSAAADLAQHYMQHQG